MYKILENSTLSFFRMIILLLDPNLPNLVSPDGVGQKNDV